MREIIQILLVILHVLEEILPAEATESLEKVAQARASISNRHRGGRNRA